MDYTRASTSSYYWCWWDGSPCGKPSVKETTEALCTSEPLILYPDNYNVLSPKSPSTNIPILPSTTFPTLPTSYISSSMSKPRCKPVPKRDSNSLRYLSFYLLSPKCVNPDTIPLQQRRTPINNDPSTTSLLLCLVQYSEPPFVELEDSD